MPIAGMAQMFADELPPTEVNRLRFGLGNDALQFKSLPGVVMFHFGELHGDPPCQPTTPIAAVVEGDIHNASDLAKELDVEPTISPAELVSSAYSHWGQKALCRLSGEWSAAIYEARTRTLILAADHAGVVPMYYCRSRDCLLWSTDLRTFARLQLASRPDQEYLATYINSLPELHQSPYHGIGVVPAGSAVFLSSGRVTVSRYRPSSVPARLKYRTDAEYEEHFRHVWLRAVRRRVKPQGKVWAELSGGLDSSSITCCALAGSDGDRLRPRFTAVHFAIDDHQGFKDRSSMLGVVGHTGCTLREVDGRDDFLPQPGPSLFIRPWSLIYKLSTMMAVDGCRFLLTGHGGDSVMWNVPHYPCVSIRDSLSEMRIREAARDIAGYSIATGRSVGDVLLRDVFSTRTWGMPAPDKAWLTASARERIAASSAINASYPDCGAADALAWEMVELAKRSLSQLSYRHTGWITPSYPYLDTDMVEFMLALPFRQRIRPGLTRSIQRRALAGMVPEATLMRSDKTVTTPALFTAFRKASDEIECLLGDDMRLGTMGLIDLRLLREEVARIRTGVAKGLGWLRLVLSAERWLRGNWG